MNGTWGGQLFVGATALSIAVATSAWSSHTQPSWGGVLDEHPSIQYAIRPTTDRVARLNQALTEGARSLHRDARTTYLLPVLEALGVPVESQLLVFSKTGNQRSYTSPRNPRSLFFDDSVVVGYIPGAPAIELAAHDPQQGVVFYTLDQTAATPTITRRTSCLTCHVSASTLEVPGMITRSNTVDDDGSVMPQLGSYTVNHQTPHTQRWGGWFVTSDATAPQYPQRGHSGNVTMSGPGIISNEVFIGWRNSAPETRGYLSSFSDIASLLVFDHQTHAINLLTRLNWESRVAVSEVVVRRLVNELADYLLFVGEAPPSVALTPRPGFAERLESRTPKHRDGRSLGQLDLAKRLLRYPCSYMVYSEAFDGLAPAVKDAVYRRMVEILSGKDAHTKYAHLSADDRHAILEILRDTKPDFPADAADRVGDIEITPIIHASVQIEHAGKVIQVDPWSQGDLSRAKPADLILVTDDPAHHLDLTAIAKLRKPGAPIVIPRGRPAAGRSPAQKQIPDGIALANGDVRTVAGVRVEAIGAYDLTPGEPYHPEGEANGYVITLGTTRLYVAGVTQCVPEIRALKNIDVAFFPLNLPLKRMEPEAAIECIRAFGPKVVYPYHYDQEWVARVSKGGARPEPTTRGLQELKDALGREGMTVRLAEWYPR